MPMQPKDSYYGYPVRSPYQGESEYFRANPTVSGMATEDGKIIFNPHSEGVNRDAVGRNEAVRLWLRQNNVDPEFSVTREQAERFRGTPYENNPRGLKSTILGRIISGDPSSGNATDEQKAFAESVLNRIKKGMEP